MNNRIKSTPWHLLKILSVLSLLLTSFISYSEVIHKQRSLYRNIIVEDQGDLRCLKFDTKNSKSHQSCLYKSQPQQLVFNYTKMLFAGMLINPKPKRILIIGLGGGTMSNSLHQLLPQSSIDNVEIDQAVIDVARQYFGFFESSKIKTYAQDGRIFIKRAILKKKKYDWIILDAFNGDYIPEHLLTQEFLQETKALLTEQGILSANTFSVSDLYTHESATYFSVFGDFYQVNNGNNSNRIIIVSKKGLFKQKEDSFNIQQQIKANMELLRSQLAPFNVNVDDLYKSMHSTQQYQDWPSDTRILTDQFSPANLLNMN